MLNLIKSDLFKFKKEKSVKIVLFLSLFFLAIQVVMNFVTKNYAEMEGYPMGKYGFASNLGVTNNLGLVIPIILALFISKEFTYNTIRNKVIWGYSKVKIYLASIITCTLFGVIFFILHALVLLGVISLIFGYGVSFTNAELVFVLKELLLSSLLFVFVISILMFIAMLVKNTGMVLAIFFGTILIASLFTSLASIPNIPQWIKEAFSWSPFRLDELVTTGQIDNGVVLRVVVSCLILAPVIHGLGIYIFNKIDLK